MPIETTFLAITAKHYKVAWISFMAVLSGAIPVLAGGVFTALYFVDDQAIRITGDMPAYYLLVVILAIYTFSFLMIWPTRRRYLPHKINTISGMLSFIYQSSMLRDESLENLQSKPDLVGRLVSGSADEKSLTGGMRIPKYTFGVYIGQDGKEHLGIDRIPRPENGQMLMMSAMVQNV